MRFSSRVVLKLVMMLAPSSPPSSPMKSQGKRCSKEVLTGRFMMSSEVAVCGCTPAKRSKFSWASA